MHPGGRVTRLWAPPASKIEISIRHPLTPLYTRMSAFNVTGLKVHCSTTRTSPNSLEYVVRDQPRRPWGSTFSLQGEQYNCGVPILANSRRFASFLPLRHADHSTADILTLEPSGACRCELRGNLSTLLNLNFEFMSHKLSCCF